MCLKGYHNKYHCDEGWCPKCTTPHNSRYSHPNMVTAPPVESDNIHLGQESESNDSKMEIDNLANTVETTQNIHLPANDLAEINLQQLNPTLQFGTIGLGLEDATQSASIQNVPTNIQENIETIETIVSLTQNPPVQQLQLPPQAYADILQNHINNQESDLALNKAALCNILNAANPPLVHEKLPDNYNAVELENYRLLISDLSKVTHVTENPTAKEIDKLREQLTKVMNAAKGRQLNYHIIQPFVLDRFVDALDSATKELLNETLKRENVTILTLRDLLATRQENLVRNWAKQNLNTGAQSVPGKKTYNPTVGALEPDNRIRIG